MSSTFLSIDQPASLTLSSPALTLLPSTASFDAQPTSQSIWHAAQTGDLPYIRLFLSSLPTLPSSHHSATSELNSLNSLYESPLHVAASYNQLAALQLLLSAQPPPHVSLQDRESGWTALHRACYRGHLACAAALVQSGVDVTVVDYEGRTAFDLLLTRERPAHFLQLPRHPCDDDSEDDSHTSHSRSSYHARRVAYEQRQLGAWRGRLSHQLYTFGSNRNYQLGLPSDASQHDKPRLIQSLATDNITTVTCTRLASFALAQGTGGLWAWGQGGSGRLGSGLEGSEVMPRRIGTGKVRVVEMDADERYACAVGEKGEVVVWGQVEWLGKEREMRRERERDKEERKEREDTLRAMKGMSASERTDYQAVKDTERRERDEKDKERREERERDKRQLQADCTFLTPTRLESCRHLTVTAVSCSAQRLFLLTKAGELWYLGHALEEPTVTSVPKRLAAMSELVVREVHCTARAVVVVTREGEVYQQVKGERKCYRVMFRFSTFSTFSTGSASASATIVTSTYSPTLSPSSPPFSPPLSSSSSASTTRRRPSAYPRIVKLSVSVSAERCMALTNNGECYWWKIHQGDESTSVSNTNSPPLPSNQLANSYAFPPFYLSTTPPSSSLAASTSTSSSGGRKVAHLVPGISHLRVVDIALGNGHTTVVTDLGDVWHWGKSPLLSHYSGRPQRVNYLHQAVRVWCSDQHVICSTVYHTPPLQAEQQTSEVATLRSMCETQLARHISLTSLLPAVSFAISLSLPSMFQYALHWLLCNFNILVHPAMKRLSVDDWSVIQHYYSGVDDGDEDEAVLRRAGGHNGAGSSRSIAHFGVVGEGEERHIGFYTARDDEDVEEGEEVAGDSEDSEEDEESREERKSKDGLVNLLAVKQWEKGSEQRRQAREERRRKRRIEEKEAELRERRREEEERWREGLTDTEIVQRLKNQLRALRKKQRRREERKAEAEEDEVERRQLWVAAERIKGELRAMSGAGCVEARVVLMENEGGGGGGIVEETKEDVQSAADAASWSPPHSTAAPPPSSAFESSPARATSIPERSTLSEDKDGKRASPDRSRASKIAAAAKTEPKETKASSESTEADKGKPDVKGWGRSLVTATTSTSAASSSSPLSLFVSIQREQEQAAAAATPRKTPTGPLPKPAAVTPPSAAVPLSTASSPSSTSVSRSSTFNPWGKPVTPPAAPVPSSLAPSSVPVIVPTASAARPLSLAEIQQEEEHKQRRVRAVTKQPARSAASATTSSIFTSPAPSTTTSPPLSAAPAPFMLQLADYMPQTPVASSSPAARTPQRGWNVSSSTSPTLPSLSLRSIQQEEAVLLPSSAIVRGGVSAASVSPKSVVWGRAEVLRVGAVVAVSGVREVQEEEERAREEERLRREVEEFAEREKAEAKRRKKEERKQREAERKEQRQKQQAQEQQQSQQQPAIVVVTQDADSSAVDGAAHANTARGRRPRGGVDGRGGGGGRGGHGSRGGSTARQAAAPGSIPPAVSVYDVLGVSKPAAANGEHFGILQPQAQFFKARGARGGGRGGYGGVDAGVAERSQRRGRGRGHAEWVAKRVVGLDEHKDFTLVSATQQQA